MGECGAMCLNVCVLCKLVVVFSTRVADVDVQIAEGCLYFVAICGYQPCYVCCRVVFESRRFWRRGMGVSTHTVNCDHCNVRSFETFSWYQAKFGLNSVFGR